MGQYETTGIAAKNGCFVCRRPQTRAYGLGFPCIRALLAERLPRQLGRSGIADSWDNWIALTYGWRISRLSGNVGSELAAKWLA